jgi:hypothetical protein
VAQARRLHASLRVQFDDTRVAAAVESGNLVLFKPARLPTPQRMAAVIGGALAGEVDLAPGRYVAWIQGSFGPGVGLYVRPASRLGFGLVGIVSNDLGLPDQWHRINVTDIAGRTVVLLLGLQRDWYKTGSRHFNIIGPVVFVPANARRGMADVPPARAGSLCGRRVDWIEIPAAT